MNAIREKIEISQAEMIEEIALIKAGSARRQDDARRRVEAAREVEAEADAAYYTDPSAVAAYSRWVRLPDDHPQQAQAKAALMTHETFLRWHNARRIARAAYSSYCTISVQAMCDESTCGGVYWPHIGIAAQVRIILRRSGLAGKSALCPEAQSVLRQNKLA